MRSATNALALTASLLPVLTPEDAESLKRIRLLLDRISRILLEFRASTDWLNFITNNAKAGGYFVTVSIPVQISVTSERSVPGFVSFRGVDWICVEADILSYYSGCTSRRKVKLPDSSSSVSGGNTTTDNNTSSSSSRSSDNSSSSTLLQSKIISEINYEVERQDLEGQRLLSIEMGKSMETRNGLLGVDKSLKWRKQPYPCRSYDRIHQYEPAG